MQSSFYDALNLLSKEGNSKPRINMLTMLAVRTRPFLVPHQHLASRTFNVGKPVSRRAVSEPSTGQCKSGCQAM